MSLFVYCYFFRDTEPSDVHVVLTNLTLSARKTNLAPTSTNVVLGVSDWGPKKKLTATTTAAGWPAGRRGAKKKKILGLSRGEGERGHAKASMNFVLEIQTGGSKEHESEHDFCARERDSRQGEEIKSNTENKGLISVNRGTRPLLHVQYPVPF